MHETVSELDIELYQAIRNNIGVFLSNCSKKYDKECMLLDIAPQVHEGAAAYFSKATIETLDIDPKSGATYISDLCKENLQIPSSKFDLIVCTEVLEHTLNPFSAVNEIFRLANKNGLVFISTPFNFRIHGPLPDCWRFTEHGLRSLLVKFSEVEIQELKTKNRNLMPTHYTVIAKK